MVLALEPRVVLLDEPTAGLPSAPTSARCPSLSRRYGLCCLLVEHDLDFVAEVATRIVVLHQGRIVMDGSFQEVVESALVRAIYAGSARRWQRGAAMSMQANGLAKADGRVGAGGQGGQPALALEGVSSGYKSAGAARRVAGGGTRPAWRCWARMAWANAAQDGDGLSAARPAAGAAGRRGRHAHAAAGRGAPRWPMPQEQALFPDLSIRDNLRLGLPSDRLFDERFADVAQLFPVFASRLRQHAGTLSGGEQKMLLVARGLMQRPALLLLDEITEGLQPSVIDRLAGALAWERSGAAQHVHRRAERGLRAQGGRPLPDPEAGRHRRPGRGWRGRGRRPYH